MPKGVHTVDFSKMTPEQITEHHRQMHREAHLRRKASRTPEQEEEFKAKKRLATKKIRAKRRAEGKGNSAELAWAKANRDKINARRRERYATEPEYKLLAALRARLGAAFRNSNTVKQWDTLDLTGCTLQHLRQHLEAQFQPGMTWANHTLDGWHIDHIQPCSSFDLTDEAQARACFHYTNLQPLWSDANWRKRAAADPDLLAEFCI